MQTVSGARCRYLWRDKEEAEEIRMAKLVEEEKAQFTASAFVAVTLVYLPGSLVSFLYQGRKSRRERRAFKEKRLALRDRISPPRSVTAPQNPEPAFHVDLKISCDCLNQCFRIVTQHVKAPTARRTKDGERTAVECCF